MGRSAHPEIRFADFWDDLLQGGPQPVISRVITPLVDNISYPFIRTFIGGITLVITSMGPPCMYKYGDLTSSLG